MGERMDIERTHFLPAAEAMKEILAAVDALPSGVEVTDLACDLKHVGAATDSESGPPIITGEWTWEWSFRVTSATPSINDSEYPVWGEERHIRTVAEVMRLISECYAREVARIETGSPSTAGIPTGHLTDSEADDAFHLYTPTPEESLS